MHSRAIRRHPDGSLDLDFYRRRAARLRAKTKRHWFTHHVPAVNALFGNALFGAVVLAAIAFAIGTPVGKNASDPSLARQHSSANGRG
jgi:hypothetical protein